MAQTPWFLQMILSHNLPSELIDEFFSRSDRSIAGRLLSLSTHFVPLKPLGQLQTLSTNDPPLSQGGKVVANVVDAPDTVLDAMEVVKVTVPST